MAVEIPRFLAWIATKSLTKFTTNSVVPYNVLNEGHAQKTKNPHIQTEFISVSCKGNLYITFSKLLSTSNH
jgi:hypothetical protein